MLRLQLQRFLIGWSWWELVFIFDVFLNDSDTIGLNIGYWRPYSKVFNSASYVFSIIELLVKSWHSACFGNIYTKTDVIQ